MSENKDLLNEIEDDEEATVTLTLEDGSELECSVLAIFPVQDKQYIALVPMTEDEDSEEGDVYLYCFTEFEDGEIELATSKMTMNMKQLHTLLRLGQRRI